VFSLIYFLTIDIFFFTKLVHFLREIRWISAEINFHETMIFIGKVAANALLFHYESHPYYSKQHACDTDQAENLSERRPGHQGSGWRRQIQETGYPGRGTFAYQGKQQEDRPYRKRYHRP